MEEFAHYLEAKRTVDDRALDRRVLDRLRSELATTHQPAVVDVGAGTGIGIERLLDWKVLVDPEVTLVEPDPALLAEARKRLEIRVRSHFVASTLAELAADAWNLGRFDLVVAHAVLDIVDLVTSLASLVALARPGGLVYLPITFDGESIFEPTDEDDLSILARYHASIRIGGGDAHTGRRLFHAFDEEPVEVLGVASSDWIVYPSRDGYPDDEAHFLRCIIGMIERTVGPEAERWGRTRREQIDAGGLIYIAHQLDALVRKNG